MALISCNISLNNTYKMCFFSLSCACANVQFTFLCLKICFHLYALLHSILFFLAFSFSNYIIRLLFLFLMLFCSVNWLFKQRATYFRLLFFLYIYFDSPLCLGVLACISRRIFIRNNNKRMRVERKKTHANLSCEFNKRKIRRKFFSHFSIRASKC